MTTQGSTSAVESQTPLGAERTAELFELAHGALARAVRGETEPERSGGETRVNVTLYVRNRLLASMSGQGSGLAEAVVAAAVRAAADTRFGGPLQEVDLPQTRIELWVQTAKELIADGADIEEAIDLGLDGVELRQGSDHAYYKPSVALTSGVARHERLLEKLAKKARLPPSSWQDPSTKLWRTSWEHYCELPEEPRRVLELRRLRPLPLEELTPQALRTGAELATDRLVATQEASGFYLYRFHPFKERTQAGPGNLVRQAGCAYAVARAADATADPSRRALLGESAARAVRALLERATVADGLFFIAEVGDDSTPARGKLGTVALTLAAVQSETLADEFGDARRSLVAALLEAQRPDGSFRCRTDSRSVEDDGSSQDFFPGEALVALAAEVRGGNDGAMEAMAAAFPWYRAHFATRATTAFVLWQVDAWRQLAELSLATDGPQAEACAEFVFEMADWLSPLQLGASAPHEDFVGGFAAHGRLPGYNTSTYTEAIVRAFALAELFGDRARAERYRAVSRSGLDFVRRLQIDPRTAVLFSDPRSTVGGTTASLADFTIRCDQDQHTLTAFLAALESPGLFAGAA